jgi:hypothetical protein
MGSISAEWRKRTERCLIIIGQILIMSESKSQKG